MRILGVDVARSARAGGEHTLVLLDPAGGVAAVERPGSLPAVAACVAQLAAGEPFLLGVDIPVVVPAKQARTRPVETLLRRRAGLRLAPGGRGALGADPLGVPGEALIAGLATAGLPCLPFPDRDRRRSGLAETYPALILKALLWEASALRERADPAAADALFRATAPPAYRAAALPARTGWAEQAAAVALALGVVDGAEGFEFAPVAEALAGATSRAEVERAAGLFDAILVAGAARRYLEAPESSLFLGDLESGYVVLPADRSIRRMLLNESRPRHGELFPQASLRERLGEGARLHSTDLLAVGGRPPRLEAAFDERPVYEFDNVDEMLWWKHCRHLRGPRLPTEGLVEMTVLLEGPQAADAGPLRLLRSRHRTLSYRFDPPAVWRRHVPTRDGRTYPFRVERAVYETRPAP